MALTREAKSALWSALRALRTGDLEAVRVHIERAMIFLELDRRAIDPGWRSGK